MPRVRSKRARRLAGVTVMLVVGSWHVTHRRPFTPRSWKNGLWTATTGKPATLIVRARPDSFTTVRTCARKASSSCPWTDEATTDNSSKQRGDDVEVRPAAIPGTCATPTGSSASADSVLRVDHRLGAADDERLVALQEVAHDLGERLRTVGADRVRRVVHEDEMAVGHQVLV